MDSNAWRFRHDGSAARHPGGTYRAFPLFAATLRPRFPGSPLQKCCLISFKDGKFETGEVMVTCINCRILTAEDGQVMWSHRATAFPHCVANMFWLTYCPIHYSERCHVPERTFLTGRFFFFTNFKISSFAFNARIGCGNRGLRVSWRKKATFAGSMLNFNYINWVI